MEMLSTKSHRVQIDKWTKNSQREFHVQLDLIFKFNFSLNVHLWVGRMNPTDPKHFHGDLLPGMW